MAAFAIYTYKFRDVENIGFILGQEDETYPLPTLKDKQDYVQKLFHDDLNGGRKLDCFRTDELTDKNTGKVTYKKTPFGLKVVWEKDGLILLLVSNPYKKITRHEQFQKLKEKDEPWCHVLIDNRFGREFMAIEKNGAFTNPDSVALILESSLRERLAPHKVTMDIKNQYEPDVFWQVVEKNKVFGILEVIFRFAAPNNPWAAELIGTANEAARSMKARPSIAFTSPDGEPIELNKDDEQLCNYVEACSMQGEDIEVKVKGLRSRIHIINVKNKYVLKQMDEDALKSLLSDNSEVLDENYALLVAFLQQIHTSKEAQKED